MKIIAPTQCPSCNSTLVYRKDVLYCVNKACPATTSKAIEHFASTLKIKGLGRATIEKLELNSVSEIYEIDLAYIILCLKSEKLGLKLFEEIQKSKNTQLNTLLPAFGIPLVGKSATEKLSQVCSSIYEIDEQTCKDAGLGEKTTSNLMNWLENEFNEYSSLPFSFEFETKHASQKGVVCISGKLSSFSTKAKAKAELEKAGFKVKDSVTKEVTILLNESGKITDKTKKAEANNIRIVSNINELIGD